MAEPESDNTSPTAAAQAPAEAIPGAPAAKSPVMTRHERNKHLRPAIFQETSKPDVTTDALDGEVRARYTMEIWTKSGVICKHVSDFNAPDCIADKMRMAGYNAFLGWVDTRLKLSQSRYYDWCNLQTQVVSVEPAAGIPGDRMRSALSGELPLFNAAGSPPMPTAEPQK